MTLLQKLLSKFRDEAVRDICSVSVAPAAKSEVRRILDKLIQETVKACKACVAEERVNEDKEDYMTEQKVRSWNNCRTQTLAKMDELAAPSHKESSVKRYIRGGSNIEYASGPQLDFSQESSVKEVPYSERDHTHCADQKQPPACGRNPHPTSCCLCGKETPVEGWEKAILGIAEDDENGRVHFKASNLIKTIRCLLAEERQRGREEVREIIMKLKTGHKQLHGTIDCEPCVLENLLSLLEAAKSPRESDVANETDPASGGEGI